MISFRDAAEERDAQAQDLLASMYMSGDIERSCRSADDQCDRKDPHHATTYCHPTAGPIAQMHDMRESLKLQRRLEAEETVVVCERRDPTWTEVVPRAFVHPLMRGRDYDEVFRPKGVLQLALMKMSGAIRSEPDWERKRRARDRLIEQRLRKDMWPWGEEEEEGAEYVMDELEYNYYNHSDDVRV